MSPEEKYAQLHEERLELGHRLNQMNITEISNRTARFLGDMIELVCKQADLIKELLETKKP